MKTLTVEQIVSWNPCYQTDAGEVDVNRIRRIIGDGKTLIECLDLDIPPEDRIWLMTRPGVLTQLQLTQFANTVADRAIRNHCLKCGIPTLETWSVKWLDGTDRTAWAAAEAAAKAASWAAKAALWAAAAEAAAEAALWAAAAEAAESASERRLQVEDIRQILRRID